MKCNQKKNRFLFSHLKKKINYFRNALETKPQRSEAIFSLSLLIILRKNLLNEYVNWTMKILVFGIDFFEMAERKEKEEPKEVFAYLMFCSRFYNSTNNFLLTVYLDVCSVYFFFVSSSYKITVLCHISFGNWNWKTIRLKVHRKEANNNTTKLHRNTKDEQKKKKKKKTTNKQTTATTISVSMCWCW